MAINSVRSDALEPTRNELARATPREKVVRLLPVYGLPILMVLLIILFSVLLPDTFPTMLDLRSIISDKAIIAILSLAAMIPMVSAVIGLLNGILVEVARIDSFIATLGTGTVLYAIALWHTGGQQVVGMLPNGFLDLNATHIFGLPITGFYVLALAFVMWFVLEHLPIGRYLYAIGANPKAAALNGIPVQRYTIAAFVASGVLTGIAGVLLASKLRIGQASVGLEYLLPALVGAFLGSTTIKPGRVNVWGTMVGIAILAIGIAGIQQFGGSFWVEPMFNGVTLLIAIGIAGYAQRRRGAAMLKPKAAK
jgi:ribose transport system permease protein